MQHITSILARLTWFLGYDVVGVILDTKSVYVYDHATHTELRLALSDITQSSRKYPVQVSQTIHFAKRTFRHWRKLVMLVTVQHPQFVDNRTKAIVSIPNRPRNLYICDIRICLVIGANLEPENAVKRCCVFLFEETAYISTLFAGGFFHETVVPLSAAASLAEVLVPPISQMIQTPSANLPSQFERKPFRADEQRLLKDGWYQPFDAAIHVFPVHPHSFDIDEPLGGYQFITHKDIDTCRERGVQRLVDDIANNVIFLKMLEYARKIRPE